MRVCLIPVLLATGLLVQGCSGPGWNASEKWRESCASDTGTQINRTVRDVDGIVFEGVWQSETDSSSVKHRSVYSTVRFYLLYGPRQKRYRYFEVSVPERGLYRYSDRLKLSPGLYRITREPGDHPSCIEFTRSKNLSHDGYCMAAMPIRSFSAGYKYTRSQSDYSTSLGSVTSVTHLGRRSVERRNSGERFES